MAMNPLPLLALGAVALLMMSKSKDDDDDSTEGFVPPGGTGEEPEVEIKPPDTSTTPGVKYGGTSSNPPNLSGDSEGYNTSMFPSHNSVRVALSTLGYPIAAGETPIVGDSSATALVRSFQRHYNWVSQNQDEPIGGPFSASDLDTEGTLLVDGVPGKFTLRAVEAAKKKQSLWEEYISSAEAGYPGNGGTESSGFGANTCVRMTIGGDHDRDSHDELTAASQSALKAALQAAASGSPLTGMLTLKLVGGLRGDNEPGQTFGDITSHSHEILLVESEIKAMTRGESVTLESEESDDDDTNHTHTITFSRC